MAMSECRECGKAVSTLAKTCPSCGVPKPTKILKKKNSTKKIIKNVENHKVEDWRKSLGLDYENDDEESKKPNVQHEVKNSDYELNWDIRRLNPFMNPLFWILSIFCSPFWYMDALKIYKDSSGAIFEVVTTIFGLAVALPICILVIKFIAEVIDGFKIQKSKDEAVAKHQGAVEKYEEITEVKSSATSSNDNFIEDVFEGKKPLAETFWLYYVLANGLISFGVGYLADTNDNNIYLIAALVSNIWAGIGTWNSSTNYQLEKIKSGQPYGWAYGAKIMIVLNFITIVGQAILLFSL